MERVSGQYKSVEQHPINWPMDIADSVLVVNGISGTGKTMMGPLLGSLDRVESVVFDHLYEYLCNLYNLGKLDTDVVHYLMGMYADMDMYKSFIGRDKNFRVKDLSGVFVNPKTLTNIGRLFSKDGVAAYHRIKASKPILQLHMHQVLPDIKVLLGAFQERVRIIEMVRHPLYLIDHWKACVDIYGRDPRDFTILIDHKDHKIPWFAADWKDRYVESNATEKAIYSIEFLYGRGVDVYERLPKEQQKRFLWIPFEAIVTQTDVWLDQICEFVDTSRTRHTKPVLKKQHLPRKLLNDGPRKKIYQRYGWKSSDAKSSEEFMRTKLAGIKKEVNPEAYQTLLKLSEDYANRFQEFIDEPLTLTSN